MLTKAQTVAISTRIEALRRKTIDLADGLRDHHDTTGSREAQRVLRCAASDLDIAGASIRLEFERSVVVR